MTKQKNIPQLRFPEFEGEWERKKLGEVSTDLMYGMNASAKTFDGQTKYIRITDIDEESRKFVPNPITSPDYLLEDRFKLKVGDILFARTGASVGKTYLYQEKDGILYFAGFLIKFHISKANNNFIFLNTLTEKYRKWVGFMSMRSGQPGINLEEYKSFEFNLPTLSEQQKIASFFMAIDSKLDLLRKKRDLLEKYKKGVMQKIFPSTGSGTSQEIRFKDENGNDYADWEEKKLGEVAERITRKNKENNLNVLTISAQHGLISQLEYFNKSVSANDLTNYYLLDKNDFAYNKSYSTGYPMGAIKKLNRYENGVVSTLYICFRFNKNVSLNFMEQYFENGFQNREIESVAQEGARNHGLLNIGINDFFNISLILPSLPEQEKIANFLSSIDTKIENLVMEIEGFEKWKKGLLGRMFC